MISPVLVVALLATAQIPAAGQRQAFSSCLRTFTNEKIQAGTEAAEFGTQLAAACSAQENAYKSAYVAAAMRQGDSRSVAERDANTEVEDLRTNSRELFEAAAQPDE